MKKMFLNKSLRDMYKYLWYLIPIVQIILVAIAYIKLTSMGIIPGAYLALGIIVLVLFNGLLIWLYRGSNKVLKIVFSSVSVILSIVMVYGLVAVNHVSKTIDSISVDDEEVAKVAVLVRSDSNIDSIEELSGAKIGITDDYSVKKGAVEINGEVEVMPSYAMYSHFVYQVDALLDGSEDAILIDDAYMGLFEDFDNYDEFIGKIKVIDSFEIIKDSTEPAVFVARKPIEKDNTDNTDSYASIDEEKDKSTVDNQNDTDVDSSVSSNEAEKRKTVNTGGVPSSSTGAHTTTLDWSNDTLSSGNGCFIMYISGIDTLGDVNTRCRSDVNILAAVNTNTGSVQLISTPRDYFVVLPNVGQSDKLTHAGLYGVGNSIAALEKLYGIKVDYYLRMNFTGFVQIIDTIGGIDVWSDYEFTVEPVKTYEVGMNHLNGIEALAFARERYSFSSGDVQRSIHQMAVIKAMIGKLSSPEIIYNYKAILDSIANCIQTSMPSDTIYSLINRQLTGGIGWQVNTYTTTGFGAYTTTYTSPRDSRYVMVPNDENVAYAHELIRSVINN